MKLKKTATFLTAMVICVGIAGCNSSDTAREKNLAVTNDETGSSSELYTMDKHTIYVKNYVGKNCATLGIEDENKILDSIGYGKGKMYLNLITADGSFIDVTDKEKLQKYCVTGQNIEPDTEVHLTFLKNSKGEEYDNLVDTQSIEEIDLYVTLINDENISVETETSKSETVTEKSIVETTSTSENTVTEEEKTSNTAQNGIRPEFKEALDSYEAFFDEYCDIMKKYMENPLDMSILTEYYEYIEKAEEMDEKLEALDDGEMSDEELKYYLEVTTRVTTKMLEIYQ